MYISIYDENKKHLTNISNINYELTQRVYDMDNFQATGTSNTDINDACYLILNDDYGNYQYACYSNGITPDNDLKKIKGLDFRSLFNTEILLDYTQENSFDGSLYAIFHKICNCALDEIDKTVQKIAVDIRLPDELKNIDTIPYFGTMQNTYKIVNAYSYLKGYLKFYEYNMESYFDVTTGKIIFSFVKNTTRISINLADFTHTLETSSNETNKAVATLVFNPVSKNNEDVEVITPRPTTIATKYYYRTKANDIVESDEFGNIEGRIYPVSTKIFEKEYLADAQYDAVYELANARYVDNVILDNNSIVDPVDLSKYKLYTMFSLYYDGKKYKDLPITEINQKLDENGKSTKIKLGFKKIYLTEIIKGGVNK